MHYVPGLRAIVGRAGPRLNTTNISTLSYALGSSLLVRLSRAALDTLSFRESDLTKEDIVVLDSMAVSLPKTRRHRCSSMNNQTAGCGVLWGLCVTARRSFSPLRVLAVMDGGWYDGKVMKNIELIARGPLYIMDRGFQSLEMLEKWSKKRVRFLVRVGKGSFLYTPVSTFNNDLPPRAKPSARGPQRTANIVFDGIATLGKEGRRGGRPTVRLLVVKLSCGKKTEELILASSEHGLSAQQLLDLYARRWEIEEFHRILKRSIGLAHLYSFHRNGIKTLIHIAALLAVLLWLDDESQPPGKENVSKLGTILRGLLTALRAALNLSPPWRPNTIAKNHWRHRG